MGSDPLRTLLSLILFGSTEEALLATVLSASIRGLFSCLKKRLTPFKPDAFCWWDNSNRHRRMVRSLLASTAISAPMFPPVWVALVCHLYTSRQANGRCYIHSPTLLLYTRCRDSKRALDSATIICMRLGRENVGKGCALEGSDRTDKETVPHTLGKRPRIFRPVPRSFLSSLSCTASNLCKEEKRYLLYKENSFESRCILSQAN